MWLEAGALKWKSLERKKQHCLRKRNFVSLQIPEDDRGEHVPARLPDTLSSLPEERLSTPGFWDGCSLSLFSSSAHLSNVCFAANFTRRSS